MANKVDELNQAFLMIISEDTAATRKVTQAIIDGMTPEEAVEKYDSNIKRDAKYYLLIAALTAIIERRKLSQKEKDYFAPILLLTAIYSTRFPNMFAKKVNKIFIGRNLGTREKQAKAMLETFWQKGQKSIRAIEQKVLKIRIKSKSEIYKDVIAKKDKKELLKKYDDPVRVKRAVRTEAHAELEQGKLAHAEVFGYTHKTWKTRGDTRVRQTPWHNAIANKSVPVNSPFRAVGLHAMYPGDLSLPVGERINCRCYLLME